MAAVFGSCVPSYKVRCLRRHPLRMQANRWLSLRLELLGDGVVFVTAILASIFLQANAGLAGLAMTSALNMCGYLNWMVRSVSEMEVRTHHLPVISRHASRQEPACCQAMSQQLSKGQRAQRVRLPQLDGLLCVRTGGAHLPCS